MFKFPILNEDPMDVAADRIINREKYMMDRACMTDGEKSQARGRSIRAEMDARSEALWLQRPIFTPSLEGERMYEERMMAPVWEMMALVKREEARHRPSS